MKNFKVHLELKNIINQKYEFYYKQIAEIKIENIKKRFGYL
jgi:hypothetical protein